jgi:hypothetical protein
MARGSLDDLTYESERTDSERDLCLAVRVQDLEGREDVLHSAPLGAVGQVGYSEHAVVDVEVLRSSLRRQPLIVLDEVLGEADDRVQGIVLLFLRNLDAVQEV